MILEKFCIDRRSTHFRPQRSPLRTDQYIASIRADRGYILISSRCKYLGCAILSSESFQTGKLVLIVTTTTLFLAHALMPRVSAFKSMNARSLHSGSRHGRCLFVVLPTELLDKIFACIASHPIGIQSLRACSLVCKTFLPFARPHLFSILDFTTVAKFRNALALANRDPDAFKAVHTLRIGDVVKADPNELLAGNVPYTSKYRRPPQIYLPWRHFDEILSNLVERLGNVHILELSDLYIGSHFMDTEDSGPYISAMVYRVKHLRLVGCEFQDVDEFSCFILKFQVLETLELEDSFICERARPYSIERTRERGPCLSDQFNPLYATFDKIPLQTFAISYPSKEAAAKLTPRDGTQLSQVWDHLELDRGKGPKSLHYYLPGARDADRETFENVRSRMSGQTLKRVGAKLERVVVDADWVEPDDYVRALGTCLAYSMSVSGCAKNIYASGAIARRAPGVREIVLKADLECEELNDVVPILESAIRITNLHALTLNVTPEDTEDEAFDAYLSDIEDIAEVLEKTPVSALPQTVRLWTRHQGAAGRFPHRTLRKELTDPSLPPRTRTFFRDGEWFRLEAYDVTARIHQDPPAGGIPHVDLRLQFCVREDGRLGQLDMLEFVLTPTKACP